jgi:hypothetical protein
MSIRGSGRGARPAQQYTSTTCQRVSRPSVLTLPKSEELSPETGMRPRLEGTQASGAGESHTQEANVAEVSYGKPVMSNPSIQSNYRTTRRRASREESRLTRPINR